MKATGGAVKVDDTWYPQLADGTVRKDVPCKDALEAMCRAHELGGVERGFGYRAPLTGIARTRRIKEIAANAKACREEAMNVIAEANREAAELRAEGEKMDREAEELRKQLVAIDTATGSKP